MADAGMLRLYNFLTWVKEMIDLREKDVFRKTNEIFPDMIFSNEMNRLIELTANNYEKTHFRDALKNGFFEYQAFILRRVIEIL